MFEEFAFRGYTQFTLARALFGIFLGLTLRRTGSLWFAVGLHCAFDWGESYLYAVPDSGGSIGPEDSVICFLCLFVAMAVFAWRYPALRTSYGG